MHDLRFAEACFVSRHLVNIDKLSHIHLKESVNHLVRC